MQVAAKTIAINVVVFLGLLAGLETIYRFSNPRDDLIANAQWQSFYSYVMFLSVPGEYKSWVNFNTHQRYASAIVTNSLGFNDRHEFSYTHPYTKAPNERTVLFTGGSAAWGIGATSTEATIAGRMEHYLNTSQTHTKYTVINLGMGAWIAYQQLVALQLWGEAFQPDWIVVMDGFNDAQVGCTFSQGVGNPFYFATMKSYLDGYLFSTLRPVFYRGWLENQLIRYSAAYRALSSKQYVPNSQMFDTASNEVLSIRCQILPTKVADLREMLAFYLKAQQAIVRLFPDASYILSTQPVLSPIHDYFADIYGHPSRSAQRAAAAAAREEALEAEVSRYAEDWCGQKVMQPTFSYLFVKGALAQERLADDLQARGRRIEYANVGTLFPDDATERTRYFIDVAHLTDEGADILGKYYADRILSAQ